MSRLKISFAIENVTEENTGQELDAVVKTSKHIEEFEGEVLPPDIKETWCTILELDSLFNKCVKKWGSNWNLEKVMVAIDDSEIL